MEYPELAVQARMQGYLTVECTIDRDGNVTSASVTRGEGVTDQSRAILGEAAVENVKQWLFQKSTGSLAESSTVQIVYRFVLEDKKTRKRTTRFVFELPNLAYVTSQYMSPMY